MALLSWESFTVLEGVVGKTELCIYSVALHT